MPFPPLVEPVAELSPAERARTARHTSLSALGEVGQRRIRAAHVAVVGAGGLGSPVVLALAAAGIGTITIIDDDHVEATNLQRQVMHRLADVGALKVDSAVRVAADLSPETAVRAVAERLTPADAESLLRGADLVIDGSDSFHTRETVAAACEELGIPLVWGTVQAFDAQVTVFWSAPPTGDPRVLADLYPPGSVGEVPSCAEVGVLGALCLQVGSLMAIEAVKLVTGVGEPLFGRVLVVDGLRARQREVPLAPSRATSATAVDDGPSLCVPVEPESVPVEGLADLLADRPEVTVLDVREPHETALGTLEGAVLVPLGDVLASPASIAGPVVVVCAVGARATTAARALQTAGVEALVLAGGMNAWQRNQVAVETGAGA